ncbi:hypothetical protein CIW83_09625 [Tissierella sp. P1]|uniref:hypothetical protein n=1 Tax=Tissierella sp. P1 TaxID=1280483 RepID=UPI000BA17B63|nr:hypothetical protein [Tissierella sp. P1]OZV12346.1 hypothetical protein CIW83_09625 [Tissierella sp. P1]
MKKILSMILVLIVSMSLFGCSDKKETIAYEFDYKFKEEYSEIDSMIAAVFLNLVDGLIKVHSTVLEAENQTIDSEFNAYVENKVAPLRDEFMNSPTSYTVEEVNVLKHMMEIAIASGKLQIIKSEYDLDKTNEEMGLKRKNTAEYYTEQLEDFKDKIETLLEETNNFIN